MTQPPSQWPPAHQPAQPIPAYGTPAGYGYSYPQGYGAPPPPPPPRRGMPGWAWALIILGGLAVLACGGGVAFLYHMVSHGPATHAYAGNEVPSQFIDTARGLGLIEPGEQVRYLYSDALTDVRNGFYFVSDRKVAVYIKSAATPAVAVPFDRIKDVAFTGSDSEWEDSSITLTLNDGSTVGFPVSTEMGRDKLFYQAIKDAIPKRAGTDVEK